LEARKERERNENEIYLSPRHHNHQRKQKTSSLLPSLPAPRRRRVLRDGVVRPPPPPRVFELRDRPQRGQPDLVQQLREEPAAVAARDGLPQPQRQRRRRLGLPPRERVRRVVDQRVDGGPGAADLAVGGVDLRRRRVPLRREHRARGLGQPQREDGLPAVPLGPQRLERRRGRLAGAAQGRVGPVAGVERGLVDLDGGVCQEGGGGGEEVRQREAPRRRRRSSSRGGRGGRRRRRGRRGGGGRRRRNS
jgi:hypothetical protein